MSKKTGTAKKLSPNSYEARWLAECRKHGASLRQLAAITSKLDAMGLARIAEDVEAIEFTSLAHDQA